MGVSDLPTQRKRQSKIHVNVIFGANVIKRVERGTEAVEHVRQTATR